MSLGLQAPEGVYVPSASYVPPSGPPMTASLISAATGAAIGGPSAGTQGTNPASTASSQTTSLSSGAGVSGQLGSSVGAAGSTAAAAATAVAAQPHPFGGQPQTVASPLGSAGGGSGFGSSSTASKKTSAMSASSVTSIGNTSSGLPVISNGSDASGAEGARRSSALLHISMHAPSVWASVPTSTPAQISVAGVRNTQQATSAPLAASLTGLSGTVPATGHTSIPSGSDDSQAESTSDLGDDRELTASTSKGIPGSRFFGFGGSATGRTAAQSEPASVGQAPWHPVIEATLATQGIDGAASHVTGGQGGLPGVAALQLLNHLGGNTAAPATARNAAQGTDAGVLGLGLASVTPGGGKNLLKPKNNLKQTSSTFISRMQSHPDYPKMLSVQKPAESVIERHMFVSRGRLLCWLGETPQGWIREPIARVIFNSPITSHDVNQWTRSPSRLDVIIEFATTDLIWLEAVSMRYSRINKGGCLYDAPVSNVRWVPGSETLFIAAHTDGTCSLLDVGREDCAPNAWAPSMGRQKRTSGNAGAMQQGDTREEDKEVLVPEPLGNMAAINSVLGALDDKLEDEEEHAFEEPFWDPRKEMLVTRPADAELETGKKWARLNPVAHWRVARPTIITDLAFSPDHTKLALTATDGCVRLINLLTESLEGTFESYYGALNRVVWSPDAKFILTAGCDDMISIWTSAGRLLGRCRGHNSFVTGLAFDPWRWRVEDRTYRFVSVGEDGCILLWDFSSAALHRPRMAATGATNARGNVNGRRQGNVGGHATRSQGTTSFKQHRTSSFGGASSLQSSHGGFDDYLRESSASDGNAIYVPAPSRREIAELQPVASFQIGPVTVHDAACNATGIVSSGCTISGLPFAASEGPPYSAMSSGNVDGATAMARISSGAAPAPASSIGTSATATGAAIHAQLGGNMPGTSSGSAASGAITPGLTATDKVSEHGGSSDLLMDIRCRPDGFIVVHRSGTLRFLRRPPMPAASLATSQLSQAHARPIQQSAL